jgi:transcription factor SPN1
MIRLTRITRSHLEGVALDNAILNLIKDWLEPLPDKSLPALNVQRALFAILIGVGHLDPSEPALIRSAQMKMIDTNVLKESQIGHIVLFYSRCPRVDKPIARTADQLVTQWMRPILRRSNVWREKAVATEARDSGDVLAGSVPPARRIASLRPGYEDSGTSRRHAVIPKAHVPTFAIAPSDRLAPANMGASGKETMERFKAFNKQLKASKAADKRV